jgi:hypothetical protein
MYHLEKQNLDPTGVQETKTRMVLEFFANKLSLNGTDGSPEL